MFPPDLSNLRREDFHRPDMMDVPFLRWLDRVIERTKFILRQWAPDEIFEFVITDDGRIDTDPDPTGSAGKHSLHKMGVAVDARSRIWNALAKWCLAQAIHDLSSDAPGVVEFEPVFGPTDRHWHLAVDPRPGAMPKFVEADE